MKKMIRYVLSLSLILTNIWMININAAENKGTKITKTIFPDDSFRWVVENYIDTDKNGYLSDKEKNITMLAMYDMRIKDTTGLSVFKHLETLEITDVNYRSDLDEKINFTGLSHLTKLKELRISSNMFYRLKLENVHASNVIVEGLKLVENAPMYIQNFNKYWKKAEQLNVNGTANVLDTNTKVTIQPLGASNELYFRYTKKNGKKIQVSTTNLQMTSQSQILNGLSIQQGSGYRINVSDTTGFASAIAIYRKTDKGYQNVKSSKLNEPFYFNVKIGDKSTYIIKLFSQMNGHKVAITSKTVTLDGTVPQPVIKSVSGGSAYAASRVELGLSGDENRIDRYQLYGYNSSTKKWERIITSNYKVCYVNVYGKYSYIKARTYKTTKNGNVYSKYTPNYKIS